MHLPVAEIIDFRRSAILVTAQNINFIGRFYPVSRFPGGFIVNRVHLSFVIKYSIRL